MSLTRLLKATIFTIPVLSVLAFTQATVRFDATLEKDLHAKRLKVGDVLGARVKSEVSLSDGTKIPKNSKVIGHVTEVKAKADETGPSRIALVFDKVQLGKNEEKPISLTLVSVAPPVEQRGVNQLASQSGMSGAGRISAIGSQSGRSSTAESSENVLKSGVGSNTGVVIDPELTPGVSAIEEVALRYKASQPDTILENKKNNVFIPRWSRLLFQLN